MNSEKYFADLERDVKKVYLIAEQAKSKGLDPVAKVEIPLARSLAEKCVGLISAVYPQINDPKIVQRILDLEKEYGQLDVAVSFKIAEEIAKQKFCKFESLLQAIDAGIRLGFAYNTLGVVSPPVEGFTELKLGKTRDGKDYFIAYFSGPIRAAGTTASCMVLMLIDYLRELFGYARYDPTEDEIKRYVTENTDYHERITNLQYFPTEEEILFLAKNLPIQIAGEKTEKMEVSNYKNLDRVDTNYIRGGMCLIFSEGLAQKAAKGYRLLKGVKEKGFVSTGWDFLPEYIELHEKRNLGKTDSSPTYIKDLVAGRPVFGHPARSGAFRFRYGRGRNTGFSAAGLHSATMGITDDFIANGTQLKIEKPTKGCAIAVCDSIDGPIVKLFNGSVKRVQTLEEARKIYSDVEEIIYMGDILFPLSDVTNRNYVLLKPGYVEEWWNAELKAKGCEEKIDFWNLDFEKALELSTNLRIPLYPKFIFYWTQISLEQLKDLVLWLKASRVSDGKIVLPYNKTEAEKFGTAKRALELLGVEHSVTVENVVVDKDSKALFVNLGIDLKLLEGGECFLRDFVDEKNFEGGEVLEIVNRVSSFEIKDKAGDFVGTRMGRPEKAKLRKLQGSPNVLFPVGNEGGRLRSVQAATEIGSVRGDFPVYKCECGNETIYPVCDLCGKKTEKRFYCYECQSLSSKKCEIHERGETHYFRNINIAGYFEKAIRLLGLRREEIPQLIKGVRGMSSDSKIPENLAKGILRAKHNLQVNKDGTIRFDATELPLVAFRPREIETSIEKLKEFGYEFDIDGKELVDENQILELMPHDILLPSCPVTPDEKADDVFFRVGNFIDELLEKFYGMKSLHNFKKKEDVIGQLGVCMAPHNCAGVICRFIGLSKTLGLVASPYLHAAVRRDCDGDEAAIMLLSDVLINFSRKFLPGHRGGTQDAPLVLNGRIAPGEVDDQILDLECLREYPLELYQLAEQRKHSSEVKVPTVKSFLKEGKNAFVGVGFTHDTPDINGGVLCSSYKILPTMQEKVKHQMELVEKIRAVDTSDTARLILERHFIRDMKGNLRKFSMQGFRCVACNEIYRRPPLTGICTKCGGKLIFTIHEGGIKKYLEPALELAKKYNLSPYIKQSLELVKGYIDSIFGKELEKQETLEGFFHSSSK